MEESKISQEFNTTTGTISPSECIKVCVRVRPHLPNEIGIPNVIYYDEQNVINNIYIYIYIYRGRKSK